MNRTEFDDHPLIQGYISILIKFNKVINLVSPKDLNSLRTKHIQDATHSFRIFMDIYGNPNGYPIYDLGTGNGIPGLIWAILDPDSHYNLVEIDLRKSEFLKHCARELDLKNVLVINKDFNAIEYPKHFLFLARAFMNLDKLLNPNSKIIDQYGFLIKGSTWNNELGHLNEASFSTYPYVVDNGQQRNLLFYKPQIKQ